MNKESLQWTLLAVLVVGLIGIGSIVAIQDMRLNAVTTSLSTISMQLGSVQQDLHAIPPSVPIPSSQVPPSSEPVAPSTISAPTQTNVHMSQDLKYSLAVPSQWLKYGYTVSYKYTPKGPDNDVDLYEDTYAANFPDWKAFPLVVIGRMPSSIWYAEKTMYDAAFKASQTNKNLNSEPIEMPAFLSDKIGEVGSNANAYVYYEYAIRQDAPQQYAKDGSPMPNFTKDFKILN